MGVVGAIWTARADSSAGIADDRVDEKRHTLIVS
jgi:hypothetical protein